MNAVVRALRQINACRLLPFTPHKGRLLLRCELLHHLFILHEQSIVLRRIRQAGPCRTQILMLDRPHEHEAHFAIGTRRRDQIHQRQQLRAELRRTVIQSIAHRVGI